jgi:hypothetical protein
MRLAAKAANWKPPSAIDEGIVQQQHDNPDFGNFQASCPLGVDTFDFKIGHGETDDLLT